jgi:hypothetical protein
MPDDGAKLFAGTYALYSGVVFLVVAGVIFAPILHRVLHYLHLEGDEDQPGEGGSAEGSSSGSSISGTNG